MPTSRKPRRRSISRLASFSTKTRLTSFQKPAAAAAAGGACDIDRGLGDAGIAGAAAVGRAGGPGDDPALRLDHHHRIAPAEPGGDLIGRARLGLEGRDAVGDALIVD